ncbi:MAG: hypothetical protein AMXMBFR33_72740 [Candidatus Xenobia bacterium]
MDVLHNPPGLESEYLASLNSVFPGWGDERKFHWFFQRTPADLMLIKKDGQTLAGSAVCYRRVRLPKGEVKVGIMTGSWTLPEARGQGCFGRIIAESVELTRRAGGALLLAFVTHDNASRRQLERAGSGMVPSSYLFATPETPVPTGPALSPGQGPLLELLSQRYRGYNHFSYRDESELQANFLARFEPTELRQDADGLSVLEVKPDNVLLQLATHPSVLAGPLGFALSTGRRFFLYSTRPEVTERASSLGLACKEGFMTVLLADEERLRAATGIQAPWEDSTHLARPDSPWYLGPWDVQSGDRT